jgi:dipeptidyl aminopeptidase/acylaminoacyl peptidase
MPRAPRPEDLYDLRVPTDPRLSPDGRWVAFVVKASAPNKDGYRSAIWVAPTDGSAPARQLTVGSKNDAAPRWRPDGRTLAFISDRSGVLTAAGAGSKPGKAEAPKEGSKQVWLLPFADGGEARQLTDLPRDVEEIAWSPDGARLCVVSTSTSTRPDPKREPAPGDPPESDIRLIDRLRYQFNGQGFIHERFQNLWLIDVESGGAAPLTQGESHDQEPSWSPDGRQIAFISDRHRNADLTWRTDVYVVGADGGRPRRLSGGDGKQAYASPRWSPDGEWLAAVGVREMPPRTIPQASVWRFRVTDGAAENLTEGTDLDAAAGMNSDLFGAGPPRLHWQDDRRLVFAAPIAGSYDLWRVAIGDGRGRRPAGAPGIERLTEDRHYLGHIDLAVGGRAARIAAVCVTATRPPDVVVGQLPGRSPRAAGRRGRLELTRVSDLMGQAWADIALIEPESRWHEVDGRRIQGWFYAAPGGKSDGRPPPVVLEIHGGPATLYGWSLMWEWQCLAASGISVYACNPRGSQGYGQEHLSANFRDWGDGPMRDVMGGLDALIADGLVDSGRMGVTGGSYGGYLTSWIVGHTDRFKTAVTCRGVNDMVSQLLSGDIGGPTFGLYEYGLQPWEDWDLYRRHSPLTYAERMTTPLLIQHAENDLRCTITQAEELFAVLRSLRRRVRLMRVPEETHELTRSGTPFRRVDNLRLIRDWFVHFLVEGRRQLPPIGTRRRRAARVADREEVPVAATEAMTEERSPDRAEPAPTPPP